MPFGAMVARYLKVFKSADPAWFYLHATCQTSAYVVGVAGWATGLKLGSDSTGIQYDTHRNIGITLFCLGTLQVFRHSSHPISITILCCLGYLSWHLNGSCEFGCRSLLCFWDPTRTTNSDSTGTSTTTQLGTLLSSSASSTYSKDLTSCNPRRSGRMHTSAWSLPWVSKLHCWKLIHGMLYWRGRGQKRHRARPMVSMVSTATVLRGQRKEMQSVRNSLSGGGNGSLEFLPPPSSSFCIHVLAPFCIFYGMSVYTIMYWGISGLEIILS